MILEKHGLYHARIEKGNWEIIPLQWLVLEDDESGPKQGLRKQINIQKWTFIQN